MVRRWLAACCILSLGACTAVPKQDQAILFRARLPRSIVVVPALNESTEVTAPAVFMASVTRPLAERGYYVFPVYLTEILLKDLGLSEAGHIHQMPTQRFLDLFGADAVLLITIKDWSTKYLVLQSSVVVDIEYVLKDTRTGEILWERRLPIVHSSGGGSSLIGMAVSAAVHALTTDYRPLAEEANNLAFLPPQGLPAGPYHPLYGRDLSELSGSR